jgi:hypothetical protein
VFRPFFAATGRECGPNRNKNWVFHALQLGFSLLPRSPAQTLPFLRVQIARFVRRSESGCVRKVMANTARPRRGGGRAIQVLAVPLAARARRIQRVKMRQIFGGRGEFAFALADNRFPLIILWPAVRIDSSHNFTLPQLFYAGHSEHQNKSLHRRGFDANFSKK